MITESKHIRILPATKEPRDYQLAAAESVFDCWTSGSRAPLVVLPTGTGKTEVAVLVASNFGHGRMLFLAPTEELVYQTAKRFTRDMPERKVGIEMQMHKAHHRNELDIVVASVASLHRRLNKYRRDHFAAIITDEAHHATATTWQAIREHFAPAIPYQLGLTATPNRHDGKALGTVFDAEAYTMQITEAQDNGWLVVPLQQFAPGTEIDLSKVHRSSGDLTQNALANILEQQAAVNHIVENTIRTADGRKTAIYCISVIQAKQVFEELQRRHEPAVLIDAKTPKPARKDRISRFADGSTQYLVNCATCTEGLDVPALEVLAMTRPTLSWSLFVQIVGRALRPFKPPQGRTPAERLAELKAQAKRALILDFVGNTGKHNLICLGDILGGTFDDDVRRTARRIAMRQSGPLDMRVVYREAEERVQRKRQRATAVESGPRQKSLQETHSHLLHGYRPHPYDVLSVDRSYARRGVSQREAYGAMHHDAVKALEEYGLRDYEVNRMSNQEQIFLAQVLEARRNARLCTWKQAVLLHKHGYEPESTTVAGASKILARVMNNNGNRPPEDGPNPILEKLIGQRTNRPRVSPSGKLF